MKNKAVIGGVIALAVVVLIILLCVWVGKRFTDGNQNPDNTSGVGRSGGGNLPAQPATTEQAMRVYLALGNPSNATDSTSNPNNYLMVNNYYALSYNRDRAEPNWVAWRVSLADMSDLPRVDSFRPDDRLPENWAHVTPTDYVRSGFDRGHVCPNADRNGSEESMAATFLMTNMTPQTPDLNRGPWEKLESYLRTLVRRGSDVYIYAGVYGADGKLKNKVTIPTNDWKIAVAVPASANPASIGENTRVIAVDMPNVRGIKNADWQIYRTTVREIEQNTGLKFLTTLPPQIREALINKRDNISD